MPPDENEPQLYLAWWDLLKPLTLATELWEVERSIFSEALSDRAGRMLFVTVGGSSSHPLAYLPRTQTLVQRLG